jgi:hypothetical protein
MVVLPDVDWVSACRHLSKYGIEQCPFTSGAGLCGNMGEENIDARPVPILADTATIRFPSMPR